MAVNIRPDKILVEIIGDGFKPKKRKCRVDGDRIIIQEGQKGRGGAPITAKWDMTCLYPYMSGFPPFRSLKFKLLYVAGAEKCHSFKPTTTEPQSPTKKDVSNFGTATVIKLAGALKPPFSLSLVYILLIVSIVIGLIGIGIASGNIRL